MEEKNYFIELNNINVSDKTEKKNGLTYLSWAWAWGEVKKLHPTANYTIYETTNLEGYTCNYFTDGRTCWVKTGVTIEGIEHIEELPVMDIKNRSIPLETVTSFDVNKAIQRSLTTAVARHGLGLYVYAGEDLPEEAMKEEKQEIIDEKQKERAELLQQCNDLGIDLNEAKTKAWVMNELLRKTGKATLDESHNGGQYNRILEKLIQLKKEKNENE